MARELTRLGERPRIEDGGVTWQGDARSMMRANLWLRTASRVLVRVARFKATAFYELEQRAKRIPWHAFASPERPVEFRVTARRSRLYHSDAIAERLRKAAARGQNTAAERTADASGQLFVVRVVDDQFDISADTSGELLHLRGYRQAVGKAPLRETLAAALLFSGNWTGDTPLLDPFCGSGTIPIEGALLARNVAPGIRRRFAFMEWPGHDARTWRALVQAAENGALARSPVPILGSDRDRGAIDFAIANAQRSGVANDITFSARAISAIDPPAPSGLVATNPPYGVRVSKGADVRDLYTQLGKVLRQRCAGWHVAMYAADATMVRHTGIPLQPTIRTSNGGIRVSAYFGTVESGMS